MTADNISQLATRWLLAHPDGNDYVGTRLGDLIARLPEGQAPDWLEVHNAGGTEVFEVTLGLGASRLEFSCPTSQNPRPWAHFVTSDLVVLPLPGNTAQAAADLPGWSPTDLSQLVENISGLMQSSVQKARTVVATQTAQVRDDLTPEPMKRMPNAGEIEALTDLIEQHAQLQAAMDVNTAYVQLCRRMERPDLISPENLTENLDNPTVVVDTGVAELLAEHWDRVYLETVNQQLNIIPGAETANEVAADLAVERDPGQQMPDFPTSMQGGADRDQRGPSLPPAAPEKPRGPLLPPPGPEQDGGRG